MMFSSAKTALLNWSKADSEASGMRASNSLPHRGSFALSNSFPVEFEKACGQPKMAVHKSIQLK